MFADAERVFLATASHVEYLEEDRPRFEPRIVVHFKEEKSWKGPLTTEINTTYNKFTCDGFYFKKGGRYLVFAERHRGHLVVWLCGVFESPERIDKVAAELDELAKEAETPPN